MRPRVICHMLSSIDGRIDGAALKGVAGYDHYEETGAMLNGDAWVCGRTTMQLHFAASEPFAPRDSEPAGPQPVHVARKASSYAISVDTTGRLDWPGNDLSGDHLICALSERVPKDYLAMLRDKNISYIVAGKEEVDLVDVVGKLGTHFGISTLLLEGGGHINGGFLEAGLVDELSLLVVPAIDGRHDIPTVFDGVKRRDPKAVALQLNSLEQRAGGVLWIRYEVLKGTS